MSVPSTLKCSSLSRRWRRACARTAAKKRWATEDTTILEVSTPHLDDVVRLEDAYGRAGTSEP